ncbi:hypothetical protein [Asanoa iriomotensis]|uniref:Uncharacterized protein n=1 Tax=Asanoa iriomotensis TaxID=234613 RepID=A0ABQ4CFR2_9ACTN|nr:hypothetical protein [Asanoa iriomotensis]GIF61614.1 hypothetical protein Air01nite_77090 [Asanoa iriomotensis]
MNTIEDLRNALDYAGPAASPDVGAIIARGRRRRRARRYAAAGGVAAVVAALVAVNPLDTGPGVHPDIELNGSPPDPVLVAAMTTDASDAPERFDPLVRTLHVGWVPAGLKDEQAEIGTTEQSFAGFDVGWADGGTDLGLVVTVLARGRPVTDFAGGALGLPMDAKERSTDDVNGRPAVCLTDPAVRGSCSALRWEYAPGAWARVSYAGSSGRTPAAAAAVARKVAESVRLTAGEPIRLPFTLTGATAELYPARSLVRVSADGKLWGADLCLVDTAAEADRPSGERRQLVVGVDKNADPGSRLGRDDAPNTIVDGHDARRSATSLVVWNVSGTRVFSEFQNLDGDPAAAYDDLDVLADPADPARWPAAR